eukprot:12765480-Prorocentrum_lima.AAC.1
MVAYSGPSKHLLQKPARITHAVLMDFARQAGFLPPPQAKGAPQVGPRLRTYWPKTWKTPSYQLILENGGHQEVLVQGALVGSHY